MSVELTMQRYSKDVYRLLRGEVMVGFLLRCADDRWAITDRNDHPVTKARFLSRQRALACAQGHFA